MTRHFTDAEKLLAIKAFFQADDGEQLEYLAQEFNCDPNDIKVEEWINSIEYSGTSGWKDKLFRTLGAIGSGLGFGASGLTFGAFVGCAAENIAFSMSGAGYGWLIGGFSIGFIIGLPVGWRTTTPVLQTLNDWRVRAYNKLTGQSVDLEIIEHDLENHHRSTHDSELGLHVQAKQGYGSFAQITRGLGNVQPLIDKQQQTIDRLIENNELLTRMLQIQTEQRYTPNSPSNDGGINLVDERSRMLEFN
jgi:hypothetical protein